jgi:formylglycine-generating enzyme required for sulfatase activity
MDFGIAREIHSTMAEVTGRASMTPLYASPEQFRGQRMTPAGDLYSLAAVLYECLAGRRLVAPDGDIAYQVLEQPFEPLADQPPEVNAMLAAGLAKDPAARPPSASALLALAGSPGLPSAPLLVRAGPARPYPAKGRRKAAWLGTVALLALAGLVVWLIASGKWRNGPSGTERPFGVEDSTSRKGEPAAAPGLKKELSLDLGGGTTMKLVLIPAGKFTMGSPETEADHKPEEGPQHEVTISKPFYMGVFEVTQAQFEAIMGKNPSKLKAFGNPVENVSWDEAVEFCKKLSQKAKKTVRLPTEAEWEYACRAGTKTAFSFGDDASKLGDYAWFGENSGGNPHLVGQKKPNPWGLYDMHGNVREWCSDYAGGSYADAKNEDPQGPGPPPDGRRVQRGGPYNLPPLVYRSAVRDGLDPVNANQATGFRVVLDLE